MGGLRHRPSLSTSVDDLSIISLDCIWRALRDRSALSVRSLAILLVDRAAFDSAYRRDRLIDPWTPLHLYRFSLTDSRFKPANVLIEERAASGSKEYSSFVRS